MSEVLVRYDHVSKSYPIPWSRRRHEVFRQICLDIYHGQIVGIYGPSGCGKSTLLRLFFGLTSYDCGTIYYRNHDIATMKRSERLAMHRDVQLVFQDPRSAFNPRWLIKNSLEEPARRFGLDQEAYQRSCQHYRQLLSCEDGLIQRYPHQLSGGQLQRLALVRALVVSPSLVFLDEASSMLDLSVQAQMMQVIKQLNEDESTSFVLISHDRALLDAMCSSVYTFTPTGLENSTSRNA